jgi:hypothetical protein
MHILQSRTLACWLHNRYTIMCGGRESMDMSTFWQSKGGIEREGSSNAHVCWTEILGLMRQMSICKRAHCPIPQRCSCTNEGRKEEASLGWADFAEKCSMSWDQEDLVSDEEGSRLVLPCAWLSSKGGWLSTCYCCTSAFDLRLGFMPTWNHPCTYRTDNWDAIMGEK